MFRFLILWFTFLAAAPEFAYAQDDTVDAVKDTVGQIDFSEPVQGLLVALGAVLLVGLKWVWNKIAVKFGIKSPELDKKVHDLLEKYLDEAVDYGVGKLEDANWLLLDTKNEAVAHAVNYMLVQAPDLLKKAGLDKEKLTLRLEAKLLKHDTDPGQWDSPTEE